MIPSIKGLFSRIAGIIINGVTADNKTAMKNEVCTPCPPGEIRLGEFVEDYLNGRLVFTKVECSRGDIPESSNKPQDLNLR